MKKIIISLIRLYQKMPLASHGACHFYPTCSNYTIEAIEEYGSMKGLFLGFKRILRYQKHKKTITNFYSANRIYFYNDTNCL